MDLLSARPRPRLRPQPRPPPPINNQTNPLQLAVHAQMWKRKEVETGDKSGSEGKRKHLPPLCVLDHHAESRIVMFASLLQFSNNPSGKPACLFFSCRIVPSGLPYSLTLSRHVTTKWYRGKCAPLSASENSSSIIRK